MTNKFEGRSRSLTGSASDGFAITPNDAADLSEVARAIYVGTAGDITVILASDSELEFKNVSSGTILPIQTKAVKTTGTTATDIIGLV